MRGFTLVEMLVVLLLASLLVLLVPPLFSGVVSGATLNASAERIAMGLRRAQSRAIASSESVPWMLDLEAKFFQIGASGKRHALDQNLTLSLTTARSEQLDNQRASIRFYPDGGASGGEIRLSNGRSEKKISVDWLTGQVNVQ